MTLEKKFYEINRRLIAYLRGVGITCPVLKYGIDRAQMVKDRTATDTIKYPYIQTAIAGDVKQNSWTADGGGILTEFDFQMNFFTGPKNDYEKDTKLMYPFNVAKNALSDVRLNLLDGVATILRTSGPYAWNIVSGQGVPSASVLYSMRAVCSYEAIVTPAAETTNLGDAVRVEAV